MKKINKSRPVIWWKATGYKKVKDNEGIIGIIEYSKEINFNIKRVFYIKAADRDVKRGSHSHTALKQLLLCLNGSFKLTLDNGKKRKVLNLNNSSDAIYIDGKTWREMSNFSKDCIILVLCDREYHKDKVISNYEEFKKIAKRFY